MSTSSMADWLKKEHATVNEMSQRLRERVATVPNTEAECWLGEVRELFDGFRAHLVRQMSLEEEKGYMDEVVDRFPQLAPRVEKLAHDHREIQRLLIDVHDSLERIGSKDRVLLHDATSRIGNLLRFVQDHKDEENDIMEFAYTQELGLKD